MSIALGRSSEFRSRWTICFSRSFFSSETYRLFRAVPIIAPTTIAPACSHGPAGARQGQHPYTAVNVPWADFTDKTLSEGLKRTAVKVRFFLTAHQPHLSNAVAVDHQAKTERCPIYLGGDDDHLGHCWDCPYAEYLLNLVGTTQFSKVFQGINR
eukprot:SAG11_NODE_7450_length_1141_cov_1.750719_1_plen_155_part_00